MQLPIRRYYRVINPDAADYTRIGLWVNVICADDDPDVDKYVVVRFPDDSVGSFAKEELEAYE